MKNLTEILSALFGGTRELDTETKIRERMAEAQSQVDALLKLPSLDAEGLDALTKKRELLAELRAVLDARASWEKLVTETPIPSVAQIRAVGEEAFFIVPDNVSQQLDKLQSQWEKETAAMMKFIPREAAKAHAQNLAAIEASVVSGNNLDSHDAWSREDWEEDFRAKKSAHGSAIKRLSVEAHELVKPYAESFDGAVAEFAEVREENERSMCARFGLKFKPSPVLLLIHKCRFVVRQQIDSFHRNSGQSPKQIAAIIIG